MSIDFMKLKEPIEAQIKKMMDGDLFVVDLEKDALWQAYMDGLDSVDYNPIFRKAREHDCSCCRYFIKNMGRVVSIVNGHVVTIWDAEIEDEGYEVMAAGMRGLVRSAKIVSPFLFSEKKIGADRTFSNDVERVSFRHFYCDIPSGRNRGPNFYADKKFIADNLGELKTTREVFFRSLSELTLDSVQTAADLISQGSIYRGEEYARTVNAFLKLKDEFDKFASDRQRELFSWAKLSSTPASVARIKNTAIGVLLTDLSEDVDLEVAVKRFETSVMAPTSYKRPTTLVSKVMVEKAQAKVAELGYSDSLERRFAKASDLSTNDILFADRSIKTDSSPFDDVANKPAGKPKNLDRIERIGIDAFISDVLPTVSAVEVFVENFHSSNLVSLIAPKHAAAKNMLKWDNPFSWTYAGEVTDSIKARVKKAGGNVEGDLCMRLAWFNTDDLDLHMREPGAGAYGHIYYGNKMSRDTGGQLDVDMNVANLVRNPVENIFYPNRAKMKEGTYRLYVHQFNRRETLDVGFEAEIQWLGETFKFAYPRALAQRESIIVAEFEYSHKDGIKIRSGLPSATASKTMWGIKTQDFVKVSTILLSPNYWGDSRGVGNKHFLFMLHGCESEEQPRGFFNEYLKEELDAHRKVLEIVGSKMKVEKTPNQLSGLGFSSTQRAELLVRVSGSFNRLLKIAF